MGFKWSALKSERLKRTRGVSFEEITQAKLIGHKKHHSKLYQDLFLFDYRGYIYLVPYVEDGSDQFLKTLYPSRKYTKLYRQGKLLCDESS